MTTQIKLQINLLTVLYLLDLKIETLHELYTLHTVYCDLGKDSGVYRVLVGKPEGRRPLGRPRHRWENNIKMDL
jgi:hypothetical protein